eukprot:725244-Pyramimonas_sp.AAC.1
MAGTRAYEIINISWMRYITSWGSQCSSCLQGALPGQRPTPRLRQRRKHEHDKKNEKAFRGRHTAVNKFLIPSRRQRPTFWRHLMGHSYLRKARSHAFIATSGQPR